MTKRSWEIWTSHLRLGRTWLEDTEESAWSASLPRGLRFRQAYMNFLEVGKAVCQSLVFMCAYVSIVVVPTRCERTYCLVDSVESGLRRW